MNRLLQTVEFNKKHTHSNIRDLKKRDPGFALLSDNACQTSKEAFKGLHKMGIFFIKNVPKSP